MEKVTMNRRACPQLGGKKCIGEKCAAWDEGPLVEKTATGPMEKWGQGCIIYFWQPIWQRETTVRMHGLQEVLEKWRNNDAEGLKFISGLAEQAQRRRLTNGG